MDPTPLDPGSTVLPPFNLKNFGGHPARGGTASMRLSA